jgi:Uma2 family endonuclease
MTIVQSRQPLTFAEFLNDQRQYKMQRFQGSDRIVSPTFPALSLTMDEILQS